MHKETELQLCKPRCLSTLSQCPVPTCHTDVINDEVQFIPDCQLTFILKYFLSFVTKSQIRLARNGELKTRPLRPF